MSDSRGMSEKAVEHNALKMTPPGFVSYANIHFSSAAHKNGKHRNEVCVCGKKRKHCKCSLSPKENK